MESSTYNGDSAEAIELGRAEGKIEGRNEGSLAALRAACRRLLQVKVGALPAEAEGLSGVDDAERLERLHGELALAADGVAAQALLLRLLAEG